MDKYEYNLKLDQMKSCLAEENYEAAQYYAKLAKDYDTVCLAQLPIDPELASLCDKGVIELFEGDYLERCADIIESSLEAK